MASGEIKITIYGQGGKSSSKEKEKTPSEIEQSKTEKLQNALSSDGSISAGSAVSSLISIGMILVNDNAQFMKNYALSEVNRYFSLTDDYISQNKANEIKTRISRFKTSLSSVAKGAAKGMAAGSALGPLGQAFGIVIGAVSGLNRSVLEARIERNVKKEQYDIQLNATNIQTNFMASRASLVNGGRGTEY